MTKRTFLQAGIGLGLLVGIVWWVDTDELIRILPTLHPGWFAGVIVLSYFSRFVMSYKWNLLVRARQLGLSVARTFKIYLISGFFGMFLPSGVGSDLFRVYYVSLDHGQPGRVAASVILEKIMGTVSAAAAAVMGVALMGVFYPDPLYSRLVVVSVIVFFGVTIAGTLMLFNRHGLALTIVLLKRFSRSQRVSRALIRCHGAFVAYRRQPGVLYAFFALSMFDQIVQVVLSYFASGALGLSLPFYYFLGIIPVCRILTKLPISINALGVLEGLYVFFFALVGLSTAEGLALALTTRGANWIVGLWGGVLYVLDGKRSMLTGEGADKIARPAVRKEA